jgi:hypothetical protein
MNKYICFGFFMSILFFTSCHKDGDSIVGNGDYLIFGRFYGFCVGEGCVETFKLTDTSLFEDTKDGYRATEGFNFVELSNQKFNLVKDLADMVPAELLKEEEKTFGGPDTYDQGGLIIQISSGKKIKTWILDQNKLSLPSYLHPIRDSINAKIDLIGQ